MRFFGMGDGEEEAEEETTIENWSTIPLVGYRHFHVRQDGRLTGISYRTPWWPGTNTAWCHAETQSSAVDARSDDDWWDHVELKRPYPHHRMENCACGFWAYFDHEVTGGGFTGAIAGVIEGWGEAVIGPAGFRVTKAKIMALGVSDSFTQWEMAARNRRLSIPVDAVRRRYSDVPWFDTTEEMIAAFPSERGEYPITPGGHPFGGGGAGGIMQITPQGLQVPMPHTHGVPVPTPASARFVRLPNGQVQIHLTATCTCDDCKADRGEQ